MSTPVNYYIGLKRGPTGRDFDVVAGTSTAGSAVDVELRMQIDNGTNTTGLTRKDTLLIMEILERFIEERGLNHAGAFLPAL